MQGGGPRGTRAVFTDPDDVTARQFAVLDRVTGPGPRRATRERRRRRRPLAATARSRELGPRAAALRTSLIVGIVEGEPGGFRNAAVAYGPDGTISDRYEKEHRVPFGEYIPARALLSRLTEDLAPPIGWRTRTETAQARPPAEHLEANIPVQAPGHPAR